MSPTQITIRLGIIRLF